MLSILIGLLALFPTILPVTNQPAIVNEAIKFEQIKNFPQSLGIKITAKSAIVIEVDGDRVLFQKNSQQILPIASLTKLMTALTVLDFNLDWQKEAEYTAEDNIEPTPSQSNIEPSQIKFDIAEKIKIKDLLAASLIKSANNAVMALVRQIGNKIFIEQMNQRTAKMGMLNTKFVEPTGLDPNNVSTAEDLAKLIKAVSNKQEIAQLLSTINYNFETKNKNDNLKIYQLKNINKLLNSFLKIKAAKTGYLDEAGYCFAGLVEYNKRKLIIVLLGSQSEQDRIQEIKGLAWWASGR